MRIGIVSDIHGNERALRQALGLMGEVDRLVCLGDSINQFRFSNEVVGILRDQDALTIWGNHEEAFFGPEGERARAAPWVDPGLLDWLASRPRRATVELSGKRILLTHATAWSATYDYVQPQSPFFSRFGEWDGEFVLYGHTHQPVVRQLGQVTVVNPGSVGEGRPGGDGFIPSCAVLDLVSGTTQLIDYGFDYA